MLRMAIYSSLSHISSLHVFKRSLHHSTRANLFKLTKLPIVSERDKNFFSNRVINIWNSLPDNIVVARSIASFKRSINEIECSHFLLY